MSQERETATRYRLHAEELRTIADNDRDARARDTLIKVAEDYERMARSLENLDRVGMPPAG